jgi:hypothetical protein
MRKPRTSLHQKRWTLRLFEWGVLACVILILMGVFLRKVRHLQAEAERLNVQAALENMRAAVLLATVLHKDNETVRLHARPGGNPAALLKAETGLVPDGYLGELEDDDPAKIRPGQWYYDRGKKALIYRVRATEGFKSPLPGPPRIRLCLKGAKGTDQPALVLGACEAYKWENVY